VGGLDRAFFGWEHVGLAAARERAPTEEKAADLFAASTVLLPYASAPAFARAAARGGPRTSSFVFEGRGDRRPEKPGAFGALSGPPGTSRGRRASPGAGEDRRGAGAGRALLGRLAAHLPGARVCFTIGEPGSEDSYDATNVAGAAWAAAAGEACLVPAGDTPTSSRLFNAPAGARHFYGVSGFQAFRGPSHRPEEMTSDAP